MNFDTNEELVAAQKRYFQLMHAMQSGVALHMQRDPKETDPKHLRVGINSSLISNGALVQLLIEKGVITDLEFWEKLNEFVERDVKKYEELLGGINLNVKLG
jgi:hypothetical protein